MTPAGSTRMRILHVSHTALVSGAEHSLLELLAGLRDRAHPRLAAPEGDLMERARARGIDTVTTRQVDLTFKRDPWATATAIGGAAGAAATLARVIGPRRCDVVHANSVRAGLVAGPVARGRRVPMVLHVRDLLPESRAGHAARRTSAAMATGIVAISRYVADAFTAGLPEAAARKVTVIDNPIDLDRFHPRESPRRAGARAALGVTDDRPVLAIVGQITPWKGHDVAVRALRHVRDAHPDALLLVVGEVKFASSATTLDNERFRQGLDELSSECGLPDGAVRYLGERPDVPEVLSACDLLLAPSHVEPFGRSVAEAMAMGVPVIATAVGGPSEFIDDGRTGWLLDPRDARAWAALAAELLSHPQRAREAADAARETARARFSRARHADAMLEVFRRAI